MTENEVKVKANLILDVYGEEVKLTDDVVIFHANCIDGFTAAWSIWQQNREMYKYIPMSYGEIPPAFTGIVYVVDFSFKRPVLEALCKSASIVKILDHHRTAEEDLKDWADKPSNCTIIFDMERSGAGLTWDYFEEDKRPKLVDYVEDRDLWKFKLPHSKEINAFIGNAPRKFMAWSRTALQLEESFDMCLAVGEQLLQQHQQVCESICNEAREFVIYLPENIGPICGLGVNCTGHFASEVGYILSTRSGTFGLSYSIGADSSIKFSIRSNEDFDVRVIAERFGGGGHKNAAGFVLKQSIWVYSSFLDNLAQGVLYAPRI